MLSLHHGDCLEVMKDIPDTSVSLILCDLPYGCLTNQVKSDGTPGKSKGGVRANGAGKEYTKRREKASDNACDCLWDIKIDLEAFWKEVRRIRKDDHVPTIHFCTTKFGFELYNSNPKEFRYDLVWDKQRGVSFLSANKMPMRSHEMIYVFSKAGAKYYRKDIEGDFKSYDKRSKAEECSHYATARKASKQEEGKRCALSVISVMNNPKANVRTKRHPTEKPIELYKWLIQRYSKEGDTILDPTFGSGNSVFTAVELGRKAIGIEKDKGFYDKAKEKIEEHNSPPANLDGPV
jgi:site-specific DNA-methyltransferase (adenine-specific)